MTNIKVKVGNKVVLNEKVDFEGFKNYFGITYTISALNGPNDDYPIILISDVNTEHWYIDYALLNKHFLPYKRKKITNWKKEFE